MSLVTHVQFYQQIKNKRRFTRKQQQNITTTFYNMFYSGIKYIIQTTFFKPGLIVVG